MAGPRVVTDSSFPIGESLVLQLVFAPDVQPFQAAGRVVWMRNGGDAPGALRYGLQWAHRTGPQHSRLRELITEKIAKTGEKITIRRFARYKMGEGLAKREDDFGDEVAKLSGN